MNDLIKWLRAQLGDDEHAAQFVLGLESDEFDYEYRWSRHSRHKVSGGSGSMSLAGAPTPTELLAEVDAKRRILNEIGWATNGGAGSAFVWPVLRLLALPYADREGYRDEWRP